MTKEERIALMMRGLPKGRIPRHLILAAEVLDQLVRELVRQGYGYIEDEYWPYHLKVYTSRKRYISFYCGGFRKDISVQQMKADGTADTRFKEKGFSTPKGAVNYLWRKQKE